MNAYSYKRFASNIDIRNAQGKCVTRDEGNI